MSGLTVDLQAAANRVSQSLGTVAGQPPTTARATNTTNTTGATGTAAQSGNGITSNDFLTLLVTEMKNQDPTQPTDPNAYIQQLVGVNSLQQLIAINNDLGAGTGAATTSGAGLATPATSV